MAETPEETTLPIEGELVATEAVPADFTPRHLTVQQVADYYTQAMREIESRLLMGHIDHVIDPVRQRHYDPNGAHAQGTAVVASLEADLQAMLTRLP